MSEYQKTALISVSDKTGVIEFAKRLSDIGWTIVSTGGTYQKLKEANISRIVAIEDFTGFPEGLDGRIKTLVPQVFAGLLSERENDQHEHFMEENALTEIDIVVCNLYPFQSAYYDENQDFFAKKEKIDIGGPSMIRAAAKNYEHCLPIVDPQDYDTVATALEKNLKISLEDRRIFASKVFEMTAHYDLLIAKFWAENSNHYPLRYGENPHQKAVFLKDPFAKGANLYEAQILNGKQLSFNNLNDANAALELTLSFQNDVPFATVFKHATPCGAAIGETLEEAFSKAYENDPLSSFGGIIAVNQKLTAAVAKKIISFFNEIVIAPDYDEKALEILREKKNLRVLKIKNMESSSNLSIKKICGGTLIQNVDHFIPDFKTGEIPTKKKPTSNELKDLEVAWKIVKIIKSNAIVIVKNGTLVGQCGGQTSRVDAMEIALKRAGEKAQNASLASDAFFPFQDAIELAGKSGISSIIQPGGSKNDQSIFETCDKQKISTIKTGVRGFLH